jgi:surface protein
MHIHEGQLVFSTADNAAVSHIEMANTTHSSAVGGALGTSGYNMVIHGYHGLTFSHGNQPFGSSSNTTMVVMDDPPSSANQGAIQIGKIDTALGGIELPSFGYGTINTTNYCLEMGGRIRFKNHSSVVWDAIKQTGVTTAGGVEINPYQASNVLNIRRSDGATTGYGTYGYVGINANTPSANGPAFEVSSGYAKFNNGLHIGDITSTGYSFPTATGSQDQVLKVDANGDLVFGDDGIYPWVSTADSNGYVNTNLAINPTGAAHNGNIGIGRTPLGGSGTLAVNGRIDSNASINSSTGFGQDGSVISLTSGSNTTKIRIGKGSSTAPNAGSGIYMGHLAGSSFASDDSDNVIIGLEAARFAVGAGWPNVVSGAIAIGRSSHKSLSGQRNIAIGNSSMFSNQSTASTNTGDSNIGVGADSLRSITTGHGNVAFGEGAGYTTSTSSYNVFIGRDAGRTTTGTRNVLSGYQAGYSLTTGGNNVFVGQQAGYNVTTSSYNVIIGTSSYSNANLSSSNVIIGYLAGGTTFDGAESVIIGRSANVAAGLTNARAVAIGYTANVSGSKGVAIGDANARQGGVAVGGASAGANDVAIGPGAGGNRGSLTQFGHGIYMGYASGVNGTGDGIIIGTVNAATSATISGSIGIGGYSFAGATDSGSIGLGGYSGRNSSGQRNMYLGTNAGWGTTGDFNVFLGYNNNITRTISGSVHIGYLAGTQETTNSNTLYIDNSNTTTPLIYGEFDNDLLRVNGSLYVEQEHVYKQRYKTEATGHVGNQNTDSTSNTIHVETYYTRGLDGDGIATSEYTGTGIRRMYYCNKFNADPTTIDSNDNPDGWEVVDDLDQIIYRPSTETGGAPYYFHSNTFDNTFADSKSALIAQLKEYEHLGDRCTVVIAIIPTKLTVTTSSANEVFKFSVSAGLTAQDTRSPYANCVVDWGDGTSTTTYAHRVYGMSASNQPPFQQQSTTIYMEDTLLTAVTYDDSVWDHTYATAGTYTITITGTVNGLEFLNSTSIREVNFGNQVRFGSNGCFRDSSLETVKGRMFYIPSRNVNGDQNANRILEGCSSFAANQNIDNWFSPTNKTIANDFFTAYWSGSGPPANLDTLRAGKNIKVTNPQIANWRPTNGLIPYINFDWTEVTAIFARSMQLTRFPMAEGLEPKADNVISLNESFSGSTYDMGDAMIKLTKNRPFVNNIRRAFMSTAWSHYGTWRAAEGFTGGETHGSGSGGSNYTNPGEFIPWFLVPGGYGSVGQTNTQSTGGRSWIQGNFDTDLTEMGPVMGRYSNLSSALSQNKYYTGKGVENWDVSNVTTFSSMCLRGNRFNGDLSRWDVSSATAMNSMFQEASSFNSDIGDWDVRLVQDMGSMFQGAVVFNQDISRWDTSSLTQADAMFRLSDNSYWQGVSGAYRMSFDQNVGTKTASRRDVAADAIYAAWDMSSVTTMKNMFAGYGSYKADFNNGGSDSIQYWDTSSVVTDGFFGMFYNAHKFNQPLTSQTVSDIEGLSSYTSWDVSNATDFRSMFEGATSFNQDLGSWTPSSATTFSETFRGATSFNGTVTGWLTAAMPTVDFTGMFQGCTSFTGKDLSTWVLPTGQDFSFQNMFLSCPIAQIDDPNAANYDTSADITNWVTTRCTNMTSMFQSSSFDQDISGWDTSNVTSMKQMFFDNNTFDQDIGGWNISSIPDGTGTSTNDPMYGMFRAQSGGGILGMSQANMSAIIIAWEAAVAGGNGPINMRLGRHPYDQGGLTTAGETAKSSLSTNYGWVFT